MKLTYQEFMKAFEEVIEHERERIDTMPTGYAWQCEMAQLTALEKGYQLLRRSKIQYIEIAPKP